MIEPREPSRFLIPPVNTAANRLRLPATASSGYAGAVAQGAVPESLLVVAWHGRWIILLSVIVAIAAGFVYVQMAIPLYTSTSQVYLDYVNIAPLGLEPGRLLQTERYLQTQAKLLRSNAVAADVVRTLEPERLRTFHDVDVPVAFVDKNLLVAVDRKTDIIRVSFSCPYPLEAAQIVNSVVGKYLESRSEREQQNAAQVLKILQEDLSRTRRELADKQTELEEFKKEHMPLSLGSDAGGGAMQKYLDLQAELGHAQTATMQARVFRDAVKALSPDALRLYVRLKGTAGGYVSEAQAQRSPLETRLAELNLEMEQLSERVTTAHPMVVALESQRSTIETSLEDLSRRFADDLLVVAEQSYVEAVECERQRALLLDEQKNQISQMNTEIIACQRLQSDVARLESYYDILEPQVRDIARIVNEDVGQLRMAILEPAFPADHPSSPQNGKVLAMALVLGLLAGGGAAVARTWFDQTLRPTDEISAMFGIPVLGIVPAMSRHQRASDRGRKVFNQPESHEAEAVRTIRTAVFFGAPVERARNILVTSPGAGDGKSTLVSNLGIAMAVAGQKTIIVDGDLRKPTQHLIFEVDSHGPFLEDVMSRTTRLGVAIRSTQIEGLSLLVCRGGAPNPAEILNSPQFGKLLQVLRENFDRVLIDAPPVNVVTDAQILAAACDCTLLVLKTNKTTRRMAQRAVGALRSVDARILGAVLNHVSRSGDRYGYYHYGRYKRTHDSGSNGKGNKAGGVRTDPRDRRQTAGVFSKGGG